MAENPQIIPPWLQADALLPFLEALRSAGYRIDTDRHIALQDLLLALAAQGRLPETPERAAALLAPLLCSSAREQHEFPQRWLAYAQQQDDVARAAAKRRAQLRQEIQAIKRRKQQLKLVGFAIGIGALLLILLDSLSGLGDIPLPEVGNPSNPLLILLAYGLAVKAWLTQGAFSETFSWSEFTPLLLIPLFLLCVQLWLEISARRFLQRRSSAEEPDICKISVAGQTHTLFSPADLARAAREMRRRALNPSGHLDADATVAATVRAGGWPTPVYGQQKVMPEYLALIERHDFADFHAAYADALLDQLVQLQVPIQRYYFSGDPRLCFPSNPQQAPLRLTELAGRYPQHRLLLFSSGAGLFAAASGKPQPWLERFMAWPQRSLLTLDEHTLSPYAQTVLGKIFNLHGATPAHLAGKAITNDVSGPTANGYPETLQRHPLRWLDRQTIEEGLLAQTLAQLRNGLGAAAYYWLSACAIYPALDFRLALYLGAALRGQDHAPLLTRPGLLALAKLPWFRHGHMPDWLRGRLVRDLAQPEEKAVRNALDNLLLSSLQDNREGFELGIANAETGGLRTLTKKLLAKLRGQASLGSPLRDAVFITFMRGPNVAVRVGRWFADLVRKEPENSVIREIPEELYKARFVSSAQMGLKVCPFLVLASFASLLPIKFPTEIKFPLLEWFLVAMFFFVIFLYTLAFINRCASYSTKITKMLRFLLWHHICIWGACFFIIYAAYKVFNNKDESNSVIMLVALIIFIAVSLKKSIKLHKENFLNRPNINGLVRHCSSVYTSFFYSWLAMVVPASTFAFIGSAIQHSYKLANEFIIILFIAFITFPFISYICNLLGLMLFSFYLRSLRFFVFAAMHYFLPLSIILFGILVKSPEPLAISMLFIWSLLLIFILRRMRTRLLLEYGILSKQTPPKPSRWKFWTRFRRTPKQLVQ